MNAPKPRILVVEDEPGIADTIRYALATDGFDPVCCSTGAAALEALAGGHFALAILDVGLPYVNGFELFRSIQSRADLPVMFLTARSDEIDRVVGLELGADDYVPKPFSPRELVARVRTVLRRVSRSGATGAAGAGGAAATGGATSGSGAAVPQPPLAASPLAIDEERRRATFYGRALELSRYEFGLLRTLALRPGRVYTREELLAKVWGADTESFDRTVDAHVKTLRAKLKAIAPALEPIVTHRGVGYALSDALPADPP